MKYQPPHALQPVSTHYCAGCGHGVAHRLICEVIDELGIRERVLAVAPVGCAVLAYDYWNFDVTEAAHGRAPAVATGMKRCNPDKLVFTYQGDGDLAAIGAGEIVNAANRGELISVFFINNANYGMTGGQMAPTTLLGQKTTTSPAGRVARREGWPMKVVEMLTQLDGVAFAARCALHTPKHIRDAKRAIHTAFVTQMQEAGFAIVELLAACPVGWGVTPIQAIELVEQQMIPVYPLGVFKQASSPVSLPS
ncbi:MAG: thiamine pyrophosphate-dependent enzyme [bacterium]|nr:thiamine pyrophosphate-dependent enzyme [bacterium]